MSVDWVGPALPAAPFLAALIGFAVPPAGRRLASAIGIAGAAAALGIAIVAATRSTWTTPGQWTLADFGELAVTFSAMPYGRAALVAVAVGAVALAVQVYSTSYLRDDDRYGPYAAQVSLFTAAMLLVVVAQDLVVLLVGWEIMGICSYLLIGHDRRLPEAPRAAVKAFLVTRVGDVGFLLGIALLGISAGSFRFADVFAADLSTGTVTTACLLLLAGVAGKSAQFPLHTWLPDAMAGPTPISALIHAATMVAAGVYVVDALYPLFEAAPAALAALAVMAAATMLIGAFAAMAQVDIKRVLAWSTVSQLGYMTGALAVGARDAALFHLLTHAAFKALLFLAAGAVIHAVGSNLISDMGGLRARMPVTFWSTTIGLGALAGLPPLAGFWSKDAILVLMAEEGEWRALVVLAAGALTVGLTGWYATRLWLLTFFGPGSPATAGAHEPPTPMLVPVALLAVPAALLGLAIFTPALGELAGAREAIHFGVETLWPLLLAGFGAAMAIRAWRRGNAADPVAAVPGRRVFANAFYLDAVQDTLVTRPVQALARGVRRVDEKVVDGAVDGTGSTTRGLGGLLATAHRGSVPRAATAVLGGALVIGLVAAVVVGGVR